MTACTLRLISSVCILPILRCVVVLFSLGPVDLGLRESLVRQSYTFCCPAWWLRSGKPRIGVRQEALTWYPPLPFPQGFEPAAASTSLSVWPVAKLQHAGKLQKPTAAARTTRFDPPAVPCPASVAVGKTAKSRWCTLLTAALLQACLVCLFPGSRRPAWPAMKDEWPGPNRALGSRPCIFA